MIPGTDREMRQYRSGDLFSIKTPGRGDLMNSRMHGSEKALADLACEGSAT
jgi:spermidine synthase